MNLQEVLEFRRSVRVYDEAQKIDTEVVKKCLALSTLAPSSSNMQLYEFYHITNPETLKKLSVACLDQTAASTAQELVVFVVRQDLYKKRSQEVLSFERENIRRNSPAERQEKRIKDREMYYGKIIPFLYARFFGVLGFVRKLIAVPVSFFRPMVLQVSENDARIVAHKSCGLAAQTFMIAMANEEYDTCPMEGFDSKRVKNILNLPSSAEINMVISCGKRKGNEGIWGDRYRVPFEEVYKRI
ncbi:nitroreductase family protein [Cloacibacterium sp.]|uniref:nitroreductase family protein n=1 Tax=Cloacibacterium sp. TaxID=1913682 RepID=UPI0035B0AADA